MAGLRCRLYQQSFSVVETAYTILRAPDSFHTTVSHNLQPEIAKHTLACRGGRRAQPVASDGNEEHLRRTTLDQPLLTQTLIMSYPLDERWSMLGACEPVAGSSWMLDTTWTYLLTGASPEARENTLFPHGIGEFATLTGCWAGYRTREAARSLMLPETSPRRRGALD